MSPENNLNHEHQWVFELLPWWVNRTLDSKDQTRVTQHIETCELCQEEVELLTSINDTAQQDASALYNQNADIEKSLATVMGRINSVEEKTHADVRSISPWQRLWQSVTDFSVLQLSATAAAGLFVAMLGVQLWNNNTNDDYSVLSSAEESAPLMQVAVRFTDTVSEADARQLILQAAGKLENTISIETNAVGDFVVSYPDSVQLMELSGMVTQLQDNASVTQVEIVH